jgi:hypothetical protein
MPVFKSTYNILKKPDENEVFDPNWMDSDSLVLPPKKDWDYKRDLTVEDIDIWEVIFEYSGGTGLYAAWNPYAEFFMFTHQHTVKTFYGAGAQIKVKRHLESLGIPYNTNKIWVDDDKKYLYSLPNDSK